MILRQRLDKIKELQEKDSVAKQVLPFKVVVVNQPVFTKPWNWTYQVTTSIPNTFSSGTFATPKMFGTTCSNFTSGTYQLSNGRIINI